MAERNSTEPAAQPVLDAQPFDAPKPVFVVGDENKVPADSLAGDQKIVGADWTAGPFKLQPNEAVRLIKRCLEREHFRP